MFKYLALFCWSLNCFGSTVQDDVLIFTGDANEKVVQFGVKPNSARLRYRLSERSLEFSQDGVSFKSLLSDDSTKSGNEFQPSFYGSILFDYNCKWDLNHRVDGVPEADSQCPNPITTGHAAFSGKKTPTIIFKQMPAGRYLFLIQGPTLTMDDGGTPGQKACRLFLSSSTTDELRGGFIASYGTPFGIKGFYFVTMTADAQYLDTKDRSFSLMLNPFGSLITCVLSERLEISVYRFPMN